jgi:hypothetical protein
MSLSVRPGIRLRAFAGPLGPAAAWAAALACLALLAVGPPPHAGLISISEPASAPGPCPAGLATALAATNPPDAARGWPDVSAGPSAFAISDVGGLSWIDIASISHWIGAGPDPFGDVGAWPWATAAGMAAVPPDTSQQLVGAWPAEDWGVLYPHGRLVNPAPLDPASLCPPFPVGPEF